jgi:hypothetical protein
LLASASFLAVRSKSSSFKAWGFWLVNLQRMVQFVMACSGRKFLTIHPSGRLRRRLIPALGGRAFFFFICRVGRVLASHELRALCCFGLACAIVFRALGSTSHLARFVSYRIFLLRGTRGLS